MMENKEDYKIYSTVEKQEVEWLWYPYIPYGKLTLLQGDPGDGKSTFMINIASALTRGGLLPDGKKLEQIGNVIYQGAEDNVGDTIKPRLEEAGADCDRVAFIDDADMGLTFIDDRLEKTIRSFQAKLLVLDPLQAFILYASRCNNFHGNVAARMNSINADRETFKMYTDIFLVEYIILAIHMNCRGQLSDQVLERMKSNSEIML